MGKDKKNSSDKKKSVRRAKRPSLRNANSSLSSKLYRILSLIISIVVLLIVFLMYTGLDKIYLVKTAVEEFMIADEITKRLEGEDDDFLKVLDKLELDYGAGIEIYRLSTDDLLYSSYFKGELTEPFNGKAEPLDKSIRRNYKIIDDAGNLVSQSHFEDQQDDESEKNINYLVYIKYAQDSDYMIKIFRQRSTADSNARLAIGFVLFIAVIVVIIVMAVMSKFLDRAVKPLTEIADVAGDISRLDFSKKCQPSDIKEINYLSTSINTMSKSLEEMIDFLAKQNEKLQEDIEQEKTIDQLRRTFISGISHELKTPIAIISGYAEGVEMYLDNGDEEKAKKYCNVIIDESGRMNDLVQRLLELIKYDSGDYKPCEEEFSIYDKCEEWLERNSNILKEKNIEWTNEVDRDIIVYSDSFMVSSIINNYLSNAVSHVSGEKKITVKSQILDDRVRVCVCNTGDPIADKDIDKIWDSFYRADKSLSRSQGRFGLGLAIVASIQKILDMGYGVRNTDGGVEFSFEVKLK